MNILDIFKGSMRNEIPVSTEPQTIPYNPDDPINKRLEEIRRNKMAMGVDFLKNETGQPADMPTAQVGQELRAASINDAAMKGEYGESGKTIKASVQANGNLSFTNVGTSAVSQQSSIVSQTPEEGLTVANIDARLKQISEEQDPIKSIALYGQLNGDAAALKATITGNAVSAASIAMGVPELEAEVERQRALDRADPVYWNQYQADSDETKAAVAMLNQARDNVNREASNALNSNVQLASLTAKLSTAERLANKQEQINSRNEEKADLLAVKKQDLLSATPPQAIERAKVLFFNGQTDAKPEDIAQYIQTGLKNDDVKEALLAQDAEIPVLSIVKGNGTAREILIQKEMQTGGIDKEQAELRVKGFETLMNNPQALKKAAAQFYGVESPDYKAITNSGLAGTKEEKVEQRMRNFAVVMTMKQQEATVSFANRADSWAVTDPAFQPAVVAVRAANLPVTMENVLRQYIGTSVGEEMNKKAVSFAQNVRQAAKGSAKSSLVSIDPETMIMRIPSMIKPVRSILDATFGGNSSGLDASFAEARQQQEISNALR